MIKIFAELDENNVVKAIRKYPTVEEWIQPDFLVEIKDSKNIPQIGMAYKDCEFVDISVIAKDLQSKLFDPIRSSLFAETEWVRQRHSDRLELGIFDEANWTAWLKYWQALRDIPQQKGFDTTNLKFPEKPE